MAKYLAISFALVALITVFLLQTQNNSGEPNIPEEKPVIQAKLYQADKILQKSPRPEITIDEKKTNPRWVQDLSKSSLRGTQVDRAHLDTNKQGIIKLNPNILTYFDYFLSLQGEMSMQRIKQLVYDDIYANYSSPASEQLYDLFKRYLAYSAAIQAYLDTLTYADVTEQGITPQSVERQFQPQYFSSEEIRDIFVAYQQQFRRLSPSRQISKNLDIYSNTPKEQRLAKATELFGAETASRLQQLEDQRADFNKRYHAYLAQKKTILSSDMGAENQKTALQNLLNNNFSKTEQVSVHAWERSGQNPP